MSWRYWDKWLCTWHKEKIMQSDSSTISSVSYNLNRKTDSSVFPQKSPFFKRFWMVFLQLLVMDSMELVIIMEEVMLLECC